MTAPDIRALTIITILITATGLAATANPTPAGFTRTTALAALALAAMLAWARRRFRLEGGRP